MGLVGLMFQLYTPKVQNEYNYQRCFDFEILVSVAQTMLSTILTLRDNLACDSYKN